VETDLALRVEEVHDLVPAQQREEQRAAYEAHAGRDREPAPRHPDERQPDEQEQRERLQDHAVAPHREGHAGEQEQRSTGRDHRSVEAPSGPGGEAQPHAGEQDEEGRGPAVDNPQRTVVRLQLRVLHRVLDQHAEHRQSPQPGQCPRAGDREGDPRAAQSARPTFARGSVRQIGNRPRSPKVGRLITASSPSRLHADAWGRMSGGASG